MTLIDRVLGGSVERGEVAGMVAMAADSSGVVYEGAFGRRDLAGGVDMAPDALFRIASMTKPVTSVAALQLYETGAFDLDDPIAEYLPELSRPMVLVRFDEEAGSYELRPASAPITIRNLLTHTSGFGYETWNEELRDYMARCSVPSVFEPGDGHMDVPLLFDPGSAWEYGISTDWLGRLIEAVTRQTLDECFRTQILSPLGMTDTFFNVPRDAQPRLVTHHQRCGDGKLIEKPREKPVEVSFFSGGGGLTCTAGDYLRFLQMLMNGGSLGGVQILMPRTFDLLTQNQIGDLSAGALRTARPEISNDVDFFPGCRSGFSLGFLLNTEPQPGARSARSLSWAGLYNTHFWLDPDQRIAGVILMQILPFWDEKAVRLYRDFERAVYTCLQPG